MFILDLTKVLAKGIPKTPSDWNWMMSETSLQICLYVIGFMIVSILFFSIIIDVKPIFVRFETLRSCSHHSQSAASTVHGSGGDHGDREQGE